MDGWDTARQEEEKRTGIVWRLGSLSVWLAAFFLPFFLLLPSFYFPFSIVVSQVLPVCLPAVLFRVFVFFPLLLLSLSLFFLLWSVIVVHHLASDLDVLFRIPSSVLFTLSFSRPFSSPVQCYMFLPLLMAIYSVALDLAQQFGISK